MNNPPIIPWWLALLFGLAGCTLLTPAQIATDAGVVGSDLCQLTAAIIKVEAPAGAVNNVLGIVCPEVAPTVTLLSSIFGAVGMPAQCTAWAPLDDSKRYGGSGRARPGQVVCSNLKVVVEAELAKPPSARRGAR